MSKPFVHLRAHSSYSLAEGAIHIKEYPALCRENDIPALALTDTANMFGSLEFSKTMVSNGVQPIIACQLYVTSPFDKEQIDTLALYAQNEAGRQNLFKLTSNSYLQSAHPHLPACSWEDVLKHNEGLILLTGGVTWSSAPSYSPLGLNGIYKLIHSRETDKAVEYLDTLNKAFNDRLYVEITRHRIEEERSVEARLLDLAYDKKLPIVATNHIFFKEPSVHKAHEALLCISDGTYVNQGDRRMVTQRHYFQSSAEMHRRFDDLPEAIENTLHIAHRCAVKVNLHPPILPHYNCGEGRTEEDELRLQAEAGLEKRLENEVYPRFSADDKPRLKKEYMERLNIELGIINKMGFAGYFLIVSDFIRYAKNQAIPVGPGRGSGAGSLTAWSLTITDMDPIRFGLIFERFLNPERVSMPDFDVDFCQERRDEVIHYLLEKYGIDKVAQIITFGKLQARAVLRDVGRVLHMPYTQVDKISKMVPNNPNNPVTLEQAIEMEPDLQNKIKEEPEVAQLVEYGKKLEGLYRHASTHAAGIVIGDRPLNELVPLYKDPDSDIPVTQFHMKDVEAAGLVKFDFLGLKTLTVIEHACQYVKQSKDIDIDISKIPLDDRKTFDLLTATHTVGVFQLESAGMKDVLRKLRPDHFEDIIAIVALYRPGPMDDIPRYISCKHGEQKVTYLHPLLEPILKPTFGVMVYQEQVMKIAQDLAGYSLGAADLLRRAMGKKIKAEMDKQRNIFIDGAVNNGIDKSTASLIFDAMAKFASYGFNKSHSAPYALLAYQTGYLKANYPVEFYAATMGLDMHHTEKLARIVQDIKRLGTVELLSPDINKSNATFKVENGALRYALAALKGVGQAAMEEVEKERAAKGPFKSIFDFCKRLSGKGLNKRMLESLIKGGAFDNLHTNRHQLFSSLTLIVNTSQRPDPTSQAALFSTERVEDPQLDDLDEWPIMKKLQYEFDVIGSYLSAHPLDGVSLPNVTSSAELEDRKENGTVQLAGVVTNVTKKISRKGTPFAFVTLSDPVGTFEITLFSESLNAYRDLLYEGNGLVVEANFQREDEATFRLLTSNIFTIEQQLGIQLPKLSFTITEQKKLETILPQLQELQKGNTIIELHLALNETEKVTVTLPERKAINLNSYLVLKDYIND